MSNRGCVCKDITENFSLQIGEEVTIASTLSFGLVTEELVNESLIDALGGEIRSKRMTEDMPAAKDLPFR